jgi:cation diffusion facilitator CzcD-associated flavoprotein CzcO
MSATQSLAVLRVKMIIVGTGFGGLATAIRLKQSGENDFIILERAADVGGVWRDNSYPGCACDVPSHFFSFSFAPNPLWSQTYSSQSEIHAYIQDCVQKFDLTSHIRFHHNVSRMTWHEESSEWSVMTNHGEFRAQMVAGAMGVLSEPAMPKLVGLEKFKGEVFHSAKWPQNFNPAGKRVAVIGTGASAIQFIPEIQPSVAKLHVFQRTAPWVMPRQEKKHSAFTIQLFRLVPFLQTLVRLKIYLQLEFALFGFRRPEMMKSAQEIALRHLHDAVSDTELRQKLTPNYVIGCKRILLSNDYYPALAQKNVEVISDKILWVDAEGIQCVDGSRVDVDVIIFGTGFEVRDIPFARFVFGKDGKSLAEAWNGSPSAYVGTSVAGFPNFFILGGPNTWIGHTSMIYMLESQAEHILGLVKMMKQKNLDVIEVTSEAQKNYTDQVRQDLQGTVWTTGGCDSWYLDKTGRNPSLWPRFTFTFRKITAKIKAQDYEGRQKWTPSKTKES